MNSCCCSCCNVLYKSLACGYCLVHLKLIVELIACHVRWGKDVNCIIYQNVYHRLSWQVQNFLYMLFYWQHFFPLTSVNITSTPEHQRDLVGLNKNTRCINVTGVCNTQSSPKTNLRWFCVCSAKTRLSNSHGRGELNGHILAVVHLISYLLPSLSFLAHTFLS